VKKDPKYSSGAEKKRQGNNEISFLFPGEFEFEEFITCHDFLYNIDTALSRMN